MKRLLLIVMALLFAAAPARAQLPPPGAGWPYWNRYAAHFMSSDGRIADPDRDGMTTSEGQAYAMFFALVADDRTSFEKLRTWTEANLAMGDLGQHLPAWSWGHLPAGGWGAIDPHSASDADLWLAYDLMQAGKLWDDSKYTQQGNSLLAVIAATEIADLPGFGPVLMPGAVAYFHPDPDHWIVNPSYMMPAVLNYAAHSEGGAAWKGVLHNMIPTLEKTSANGYAMDWSVYADGKFSPHHGPGNDAKPAQGSYDAIRVYLWIGIGSQQNMNRRHLLASFGDIAALLRAHPVPPEAIAADGTPSGAGPLGFSAALVPYLWSSQQPFLAAEQQRRMQAGFNPQTGLLGSPARYYDQNLALFATGWQEKRFRFAVDGMLRVQWKK